MLLLILGCATPLSAQAWRPVLTAAADASLWIDAMQTIHARRHGIMVDGLPRVWMESNPILGPFPSAARVIAYNAAWIGLNTFAPKKVRPFLNVAVLAIELYIIKGNGPVRVTP